MVILSSIFVNGVQLEVWGSENRWEGDKMRGKLTNVMLMVGTAGKNIICLRKRRQRLTITMQEDGGSREECSVKISAPL